MREIRCGERRARRDPPRRLTFPVRRTAAAVAAVAQIAILALTGCGDDRADVEATLRALQRDVSSQDLVAVCAAMAERSRRQLATVGHDPRGSGCEHDLGAMLGGIEPAILANGGVRAMAKPRVVAVDVAGDRATARMASDSGPMEVALVKEDGEWKLDNFFGTSAPPPRDLD